MALVGDVMVTLWQQGAMEACEAAWQVAAWQVAAWQVAAWQVARSVALRARMRQGFAERVRPPAGAAARYARRQRHGQLQRLAWPWARKTCDVIAKQEM